MGIITSSISKFILRMAGWKLVGEYAGDIKKKVMIAAPHTSGWDLPLGLLVRSAIKAKIQFVGKDSLFKPPFGWILRALGGVPVDRSKSNNFVEGVVQIFSEREKFNFFLAPEGTRKKVEKFKSGFYYIAVKAKVPIQMMKLNYKERLLEFVEPYYPTGDFENDMKYIEGQFRGVIGKIPKYSFT